MTLTELVPSREVCQRLKQAGFPQDTALVWFFRFDALNHYSWVTPRIEEYNPIDDSHVAAPTAEEILKELPRNVDMKQWVRVNQFYDGYGVEIRCGGMIDGRGVVVHTGPHLVDNLATAYLWWKEQE
jgi:hypothetical protein